jgi:hypothetical protein
MPTTVSHIEITALYGNTGYVYVGNADVSSTRGTPLDGGDTLIWENVDVTSLWIDSSVNGEGVSWNVQMPEVIKNPTLRRRLGQ